MPSSPYYFGDYIAMLDQRVYPGWMKLSEGLRCNSPTTWDPAERASLFDADDPAIIGLRGDEIRLRAEQGPYVRIVHGQQLARHSLTKVGINK